MAYADKKIEGQHDIENLKWNYGNIMGTIYNE